MPNDTRRQTGGGLLAAGRLTVDRGIMPHEEISSARTAVNTTHTDSTGLSLNHFVGAQEDRLGDRNAERLRSL